MKKSIVSAGIVTYNNAAVIKACIDSIFKYTKDLEFQLWVYDNCSSDATVNIVQSNYPQVRLILGDKNLGYGQAHNKIIERVKSEYHVIVNPDIIISQGSIETLVDYMEKNKHVVQVTPKIKNMDGSVQHLPKLDPNFRFVILSKFKPFRKYRKIYTQENKVFNGPTKILSSTGCFSVIRTNLLKQIQGYDKRYFMYFEDADLSRRIREYGDIIYYPDTFVYHEWKRDNVKNIKGIYYFLASMCKYYRKWC